MVRRKLGLAFATSVMLLLALVSSVTAQVAYKVTLAPIFRPGVQLDSQGPDIRYVDVDLIARSNIEYWTVQFSCTVNKLILADYNNTTSTTDDAATFSTGDIYGGSAAVVKPTYNDATGVFTVSVSRVAPSTPIGGNDVALILGTLHFRVKTLATPSATSTFVCTSAFLDRNGQPVVAVPTYVAPAPLSILKGYQITGSVAYQGRTAHAGITVTCGANPPATTLATGAFTVNGRLAGQTNCSYAGLDIYLQGRTTVNVGQGGVRIPPVQLPAGNTSVTPATNVQAIDGDDLLLVTAGFGNTGVTATTPGNTNGDTAINQADVALVTSNYGSNGPIQADHLLVSYARDYTSPDNKRAFLLNNATQTVTQAVAGTAKVYHATLSPDGSKIAYVSEVTAGRYVSPNYFLPRYALFVAPAPGLTGAPVRLTPLNWQYDAFYPSWSEDGTTLGFVCGQNYGTGASWSQSYNNPTASGNLCTVSISGQNLSVLPVTSELFAPSWYQNSGLIYGDPYALTLNLAVAGNGTPISSLLGAVGHMPVWRGDTLYYVSNDNQNIWIAAGATGNPLIIPSQSTTPTNPGDEYNQLLVTPYNPVEYLEVSDFTGLIYSKRNGQFIETYQYNGDPISPNAPYTGYITLPQYAYVYSEPALADRVEYTP